MLTSLQTSDLKLLRVFMLVAKSGGLTAAQNELNMSLPSISSYLQALEKRLGLKLCTRGRGGLRLTKDGHKVYSRCNSFFGKLDNFFIELKSSADQLTGNLMIGTNDGEVGNRDFTLWKTIAAFHRLPRNNVVITIDVSPHDRTLKKVINGEYHIGIGHFPNAPKGISRIALFRERQILYCGRDHPFFSRQGRITTEELSTAKFVLRGTSLARETPNIVASQKRAAISPTAEGRATFILSGEFVGYLPAHFARQWTEKGQMLPIFENELSYVVAVHALVKNSANHPPFLKIFLNLMSKTVNADHGESSEHSAVP